VNNHKTMKKNAIILLLLAVTGVVYSENMLSISLEVYKNGTVEDRGIRIINNDATKTILPGDYILAVSDEKNNTLWGKSLTIPFLVLSDPPEEIEHSPFEVIIPYDARMKHVALYLKGRELFASDINICNGDLRCNTLRENYLSCPGDCPAGKPDMICIADSDHICDPDCLAGLDQDCNRTETGAQTTQPVEFTTETLPENDSTPDCSAVGDGVCKTTCGDNNPACAKKEGSFNRGLLCVAAVLLVVAALWCLSERKGTYNG